MLRRRLEYGYSMPSLCLEYLLFLFLHEPLNSQTQSAGADNVGGSGIETEVTDDGLCRNQVFIGHERQNIDQLLCQRGLYRPFIDQRQIAIRKLQ